MRMWQADTYLDLLEETPGAPLRILRRVLSVATLSLALVLEVWQSGWAFASLLLVGFIFHDAAHRLVARRLKFDVSLPVYIPVIGSFISVSDKNGILDENEEPLQTISSMGEELPDEGRLFQAALVALSGPAASMSVAMSYMCLGRTFHVSRLLEIAIYLANWTMLSLAPVWMDGKVSTRRLIWPIRLAFGIAIILTAFYFGSQFLVVLGVLFVLSRKRTKYRLSGRYELLTATALLALFMSSVAIDMVVRSSTFIGPQFLNDLQRWMLK